MFNLCPRKSSCRCQISATADAFNNIFCQFPKKTIANVVSTASASEYMDKLYNRTIPSLEFIPEPVSLIISSLYAQKISGADGLPTRVSPYMARLFTA